MCGHFRVLCHSAVSHVPRDGSVPMVAAGDTAVAQSPSVTQAELCLLCHTGIVPMGTRAPLSTGHRPWEAQRGVEELQATSPLQVSGTQQRGDLGVPVPREGAANGLWGGHVWGAAPKTESHSGVGASPPVGLCQIFLSHTPFPKAQGNPRDKSLALTLFSPLSQVFPMKLISRRTPERPG